MQVRTVSQKFSHPLWGRFSKNYGADQQWLQISDLHFDKFPTPATFACWKIRFKTEVCTCSQFPTEALLWIKEVEMVGSVDDLESSCSVKGIHMRNFEVLDAKIASALNRIIHNSHFKRRVSLEEQKAQKEDSFLRGRQIASSSSSTSGSLEPTILSIIMPTYLLLLFVMTIFRNSTQSGTEIFIINDENPTWWHLGRTVQIENTRVWETQDRIGIVWPGDSSEESWTWLSQIENDGKKKYRARLTK